MTEHTPTFDIERAKAAALSLAQEAYSKGALFDTMPDESDISELECDPETLDSITELVLIEGIEGMELNDARERILDMLFDTYPDLP